MTDATVAIGGQINGAGDVNAMFLKVFSGETLRAFENAVVTMDKHMVRTITSGKSAQFPRTGRASGGYHTAGAEILGQTFNSNERVISINDILYSDYFLDELDEAKNHYDLRGAIAHEMGVYLANQFDKHVLQTIYQAGLNTTAEVTGETDMVGKIVTDADADTNADSLVQSIFDLAQNFDEKSVPAEDRYVAVKPAQYYLLANSSKIQNLDYGNSGNGSTAEGRVMMAAGMKIIKTNNLPTTNITAGVDAGTSSRQAVDARNAVALAWHPSAAGTVKLLDLKTSLTPDPRRLGELLVARYAVGHGVLRSEAAGIIRTATPV